MPIPRSTKLIFRYLNMAKKKIVVEVEADLLKKFLKLIDAPKSKVIEALIFDFVESAKPIGVQVINIKENINDLRRESNL